MKHPQLLLKEFLTPQPLSTTPFKSTPQPLLTNPIWNISAPNGSCPIHRHSWPFPSAPERFLTNPIHYTDTPDQSHELMKDFWLILSTTETFLTNPICSWNNSWPNLFTTQTLLTNPICSPRNLFWPICGHSWRNFAQSHPLHWHSWPIQPDPKLMWPIPSIPLTLLTNPEPSWSNSDLSC